MKSDHKSQMTPHFFDQSPNLQLTASFTWLPLVLLLLLPLLLIYSFGLGGSRRRTKYRPRLPPGPCPLPIIGSLHELVGHVVHVALHRLSKEHGPLMHLNLGSTSAVVASSIEVASEILKTQDTVFCSRPRLAAVTHFSYGGLDIGASPYGDRWRKLRHFGSLNMFNHGKVQSFRAIREQEVHLLVDSIRKASSRWETTVNLSEMAVCLFNNITYREVFSKRATAGGDCSSSPHHGLIMDMMTMMTDFNFGDFFPSFWWLDFLSGWRFKLHRRFREMDMIFEKEIQQRLLLKSAANHNNVNTTVEDQDEDFLDAVLRSQVEVDPSFGFLLSRKQAKALLMDMFLGGTDTSSVTLEWGMAELMRNPEAMRRAQEEVRRIAGDKGKVEDFDVENLHYLKMVVKETLRLHPATTLLAPRESMKDAKINGYDIPEKTMVIINAWAIGRDPRYWDQPEKFRPERFENSAVTFKGSHFELIPFGSGRRICPGKSLDLASIELAFANLLYSFQWNLPNVGIQKEVNMEERFGLSTHKKTPLLLMATPYYNYKPT